MNRFCLISSFLFLLLIANTSFADVRLPRLISDGAVLQRDKPIIIWGWADNDENIVVRFAGQKKSTTAKQGRWQVDFLPRKAGETYELHVDGKNHLTIKNIVMGDVWIASGQSNMEFKVNQLQNRFSEITSVVDNKNIREFSVPTGVNFNSPNEDYNSGSWSPAAKETIGNFSAVGFFFARAINTKNNVPIGLITAAVGGSPAEAWMSSDALASYPHYLKAAAPFKDDAYVQSITNTENEATTAWFAKLDANDAGVKGNWESNSTLYNSWKPFVVPRAIQSSDIPFVNGSIWFQKSIFVSDAQATLDATLWLGAISDGNDVYINGQLVAKSTYSWESRIYKLPKGALRSGNNNICIRLISFSNNPRFVADKKYEIQFDGSAISLTGEWKYKIGVQEDNPFPKTTVVRFQPTALFNGELAPLFPMRIKGVIWYQGESNVQAASEYTSLFPALISDWRRHFNQGDLPFIFVQLANFQEAKEHPSESEWAELRNAQLNALKVPNTGMAVAIDLGEWNDVHPLNKKDVGERLALQAQRVAYGDKSIVSGGPLYKSIRRQGEKLVVAFTNVGGGLVIKIGSKPKEIAIAGLDKKYVWANAEIVDNQLYVWSDLVKDPISVRYAWAHNPKDANLYNREGLPASPFQADFKF